MAESGLITGFVQRALLAALIATLALFAWAVRDAVLLAFAAILLAVAVHGLADVFEDKAKLARPLALGVAGSLLVGVVSAALWLFGAQLAAELASVADRLPQAWDRFSADMSASPLGASVVSEIDSLLKGESGLPVQDALRRAGAYTLPIVSGLTTALLVFFTAVFLTSGAASYRRGALTLFPKGVDAKVGVALDEAARALKKWLLGITIDMVVIALALGVTLWALGVPAFIGLALIAGFAQFVPTIGPLIAAIPGVLLAFTVGPMTALWTALAYLVISQLEANVVYPIVQKRTASIPPALNLVAVLAFGMLLGPLGVLLATPVLVVIYVFVARLYVRGTLGKSVDIPGA